MAGELVERLEAIEKEAWNEYVAWRGAADRPRAMQTREGYCAAVTALLLARQATLKEQEEGN